MKKIAIVLAALCVCSSAYAVNFFFEKKIGYWKVIGYPGDKDLNPACITSTSWDDGSYLNLIQDLKDGELLIEFKSNDWNVGDVNLENEYEMTLNVYTRNKSSVKSWPTRFRFLSKNTINIRGLDYKTFLPAFMNYNKMVFIMPGTVPNAEIDLKDSTEAINYMSQCLDASKNIKPETEENGAIQQKI